MFVQMTMAELKKDFHRGLLKRFRIEASPMEDFFELHVDVETASFRQIGVLADARTKQPRKFKSVDTALRAAQDIGFTFTRLEGV